MKSILKSIFFLYLSGSCSAIVTNRTLEQAGSDSACQALRDILAGETGSLGAGYVQEVLAEGCSGLTSPTSDALSGGFCGAAITEAGWYRTSSVNEVSALILQLDAMVGQVPIATTSNSGGTAFVTRYFTFRDLPTESKWTYPCYLLTGELLTVCFFHGEFGKISGECEAQKFNMVSLAYSIVFGPLQLAWGGPWGELSSYNALYWPFLSDLPLSPTEYSLEGFWSKHSKLNEVYNHESNWNIAFTSGGGQMGNEIPSYSWDHYYPRRIMVLGGRRFYSNITVFKACSVSANTYTGYVALPFAFPGMHWDGAIGNPLNAGLKMVGMAISLLTIKKLIAQHTLMAFQSHKFITCVQDCIAMDGAFSDNTAITQTLSYNSAMPSDLRSTLITAAGPNDALVAVKFLMGTGPMGLYSASGINLCPFTYTSLCKMLGTLRSLFKEQLNSAESISWDNIGNVYLVWKPAAQAMLAYCGDPLAFDEFAAACEADAVCHIFIVLVPGHYAAIEFTPETYVLELAFTYIGHTPVAGRFVEQHIPWAMTTIEYYSHMKAWFPDFSLAAPAKGGIAFTKPAGHALLDFMTYLAQRLTFMLVVAGVNAKQLFDGKLPSCEIQVYKKVAAMSTDHMLTGRSFVLNADIR